MFCAEIARMVENRGNLSDDWLVTIDLGLLRSAVAEVENYKLQIDRLEARVKLLETELNWWIREGTPNV